MIVSTNPIVLGNMPQPTQEKNSVKIAFMGQVPTLVLGKVSSGDYILPNELGIGFARAVHPNDMKTRDYKKVAGVAWNILEEITDGLRVVNVAVGINTNDLSEVVAQQEEELMALKLGMDQLSSQVNESNAVLTKIVPGYAKALGLEENDDPVYSYDDKLQPTHPIEQDSVVNYFNNEVIYFEMSKEQVEAIIEVAREQYMDIPNQNKQLSKLYRSKTSKSDKTLEDITTIPIEDHPFWKKMDNDPAYKQEVILYVQSLMEKSYHTHKKYKDKFANLKVKE